MPRMWKDKTDEELREEWHEKFRQRDRMGINSDAHAEEYAGLGEAMDAIELEIGRRKKPPVEKRALTRDEQDILGQALRLGTEPVDAKE